MNNHSASRNRDRGIGLSTSIAISIVREFFTKPALFLAYSSKVSYTARSAQVSSECEATTCSYSGGRRVA